MLQKRIICLLAAAGSVMAASGGGGGTGVTATGAAEVRTFSEIIPAGGTVQVKHALTQPRPITSGGTRFALDGFAVDGVSVNSPLGTTAATAVYQNGGLNITVISPDSDFGSNLDYPFLMITMDVPATVKAGAKFTLTLPDTVYQTPTGPVTLSDTKPGTLTIGGSLSVNGVFPGGGSLPAGTLVRVRGTGFQAGTKLVSKFKMSKPVFVSSNELDFTLLEPVVMDAQKLTAQNPDGSQVTYFSYLRGVAMQKPSSAVLAATETVFQQVTRTTATFASLPADGGGKFTGLALQNPNLWDVSVMVAVNGGTPATFVIPAGGKLVDTVAALTGGTALTDGSVVSVTATSGVQVLGLAGDEGAFTVVPVLPVF